MKMLSERMALALARAGKKQTELAAACKIKPASVNDWLSGKTKSLRSATAHRAAAFLGVSFLWLTEGTGPMYPTSATAARSVAEPPQDWPRSVPLRRDYDARPLIADILEVCKEMSDDGLKRLHENAVFIAEKYPRVDPASTSLKQTA